VMHVIDMRRSPFHIFLRVIFRALVRADIAVGSELPDCPLPRVLASFWQAICASILFEGLREHSVPLIETINRS
jgi:hypothetical protein